MISNRFICVIVYICIRVVGLSTLYRPKCDSMICYRLICDRDQDRTGDLHRDRVASTPLLHTALLYLLLCITHPTKCLLPLTAGVVGIEFATSPLTAVHSAFELHATKYQNELLLVVLHSLLLFVL